MIKLLPKGYEMLNKEHAYYLLQKLMDGKATSSERATLSQLLQQNHPQEQWIELMEELYHVQNQTEQPAYIEAEWKSVLEQLFQDVRTHNAVRSLPTTDYQKSFNWRRLAVAASILIIIGIAAYWTLSEVEGPHKKELSVVEVPHDVAPPDKNRAQIKLANGSIVYLDSAANGEIVNTNGVAVTKTEDGKIVYSSLVLSDSRRTHDSPLTTSYNTLTNPRGSKVIDITLSDGSRVWLNAGSSITYPVAFTGNERKVTMTGEAYFEVAKVRRKVSPTGGDLEGAQPFIVSKGDMQVQVLGTHFNVNAYDDESEIKVTLLEGSVNVSRSSVDRGPSTVVHLKPGQQAVLTTHDSRLPDGTLVKAGLTTNHSPDLEQILAWRNNKFIFNSASIQTIATQLEKWYDVDINIQPGVTDHFTGIISRSVNASEVFGMLQRTGTMNVKINGRKIEISK